MTGIGYPVKINITLSNLGDFPECFNVTVYANTTVIQTILVMNVSSTKVVTIIVEWDNAGFAKGNYAVSAYAWPVPGETETTDNTFTNGIVYIGIPGDINGDGIVDIFDAVLLAAAAGSMPGSPNWNPNADINNDNIVDIFDAVILAAHAGQTDP